MRYAVYAAPPPASALHAFASSWLGRDADSGQELPQPVVPGLTPDRLEVITASPRLYGFHATLKAPFEPADGVDADAVDRAVAALARRLEPLAVPLELGSIGGFLALVPARPLAALEALATACTAELDCLRAPLSSVDLERRRAAGLSAAEDAYLVRYGYPYVMELFRYHMTLTERLSEPLHGQVLAALAPMVAPVVADPFVLDELVVFVQPSRERPFVATTRHRLGG